MSLEVGSRLGHHDVTALIGERGMGQVYQATDTKLNRKLRNFRAPDIHQELSLLCRHLRGLQHQLEIGVKGRHAVLMCHESHDVPFVVLVFIPYYSA